MSNQNLNQFGELGDRLKTIIDDGVNSQDYQKMTKEIKSTVNDAVNLAVNTAVETGSTAIKNGLDNVFGNGNTNAGMQAEQQKTRTQAFEEKRKQERAAQDAARSRTDAKKEMPALYEKMTGVRVKGLLMSVTGGILASGMGLGCLVLGIFGTVAKMNSIVAGGIGFLAAGAVIGGGFLAAGVSRLGSLNRFQKYQQTLGDHTYSNFEQLSIAVDKPVDFVKKDIKKMIARGWFRQGHIDNQETCLITSNETYRQYTVTQKALEQRTQEEQKKQAEADRIRQNTAPEVQEILDKGNDYLKKLRECNDAIPGEMISAKISRMELIVKRILERAQEHPEIVPDLKKMMSYYLPITVKLLNAYEEMDSQPVQGENITSSKKEIEETIDTLNVAFEKLLDSIFQDTAMDVSSDISVLHTVLAQEGLTENEFDKIRKEAAAREKTY